VGALAKSREVGTDLRQKSLGGKDVDAWNLCQVHSENSVEVTPQFETGIALKTFHIG
jgi:hypothetical protein